MLLLCQAAVHCSCLQYTENLYGTVFRPYGNFWLRENGEPRPAVGPAPSWHTHLLQAGPASVLTATAFLPASVQTIALESASLGATPRQ